MTLGSRLLATSLLLVVAANAGAAEGEAAVTGPARVIDGDTIEVDGTAVRLHGIDAPETGQQCLDGRRPWACGKDATRRLGRLIGSQPVTCRGRDRDDYGRLIAVCTASGRELNGSLVREGFAWAFIRYSRDYEKAEAEARAAKRGVFVAENTPPWDFRAGNWEGARKTVEAEKARSCPIKGNVSAKGERIYHLPWQHDYARTKVSERTGERWFCTEGEAEKADWRRAGR